MNTLEQHTHAVSAFIEALWNQGELEVTEQFFVSQLREAFTDRRCEVEDLLVQGDKVAARIVITGTHSGTFAGNPPTGRAVRITQFREFRLLDGRVAEHRGWFDTGTLLPQIQTGSNA
ncbi:ester cyclase [Paenibacillus sp. HJGM_3]|uniref:ester cyclase n=1 Tax=Paenibacillus sp. HJGM_3 TaxID=3379816 RepID=UPI00385C610F